MGLKSIEFNGLGDFYRNNLTLDVVTRMEVRCMDGST